jgi:hypothetical protein
MHYAQKSFFSQNTLSFSPICGIMERTESVYIIYPKTIKTKDDQIAILQNLLKEKDDHISTLKSRTAELRRIIDSNQYSLERLPFPPGVADKPNDKTHVNK